MPRPREDRLLFGVALGFAAVLALVASALISYASANRWVDHTLEVRQQVDAWTVALLDAQASVRGYLLSGQGNLAAPYEASIDRERATAAHLRDLVVDNPVQTQNVENADRDAQAVMDIFRQLVSLENTGRRQDALAIVATGESQRRMDAFREGTERVRAEEGRLLLERRFRARLLAQLTLAGGLLLVLAAAASLALAWGLQRRRSESLDKLATVAHRRLEALSEVTAALADARSRAEVAETVVDHGKRAVGADTCTLYMVDPTGTVLELIGDRGVAPEVLQKIRRISEEGGGQATFATLRSGTPIWAENETDYARIFPALAATKTSERRAKAFWSMPLTVEGRPVGLLGMGFYQPRAFSADERGFIATFSKQCAQALVRASHMEREDEARQWFETTLRSIGDAVIATDPQGRVTFVNPVAERLIGWTDGEARGKKLQDVFTIFSERTRKEVENPVARVLLEGKVVGLANHTVLRSRDGLETPIDDSAAPIRDESGRLFGVVLVFRDVSDEKRGHARREFLARAGEALVSSLDYQRTLATVASFAVPQLADWCSVEILEPGSTVPRQLAVAHVDPSKVQFAKEMGERYPPDPNAKTGVPEVIRTGRSLLYAEIPAAVLEAGAQDAEHLRLIRELQLESAMVVPLRARARVIGAMTFIYAASGRRYTETDLGFAEDFARRAATAIENAMAMKDLEEARSRERLLRGEAEFANRAKDEFLATVSHELRTPLNAILGWVVTLRARKLPEDIDRPLSVVERNARAQAKLIEDVLDVSRIISGKLALNLGATDVGEAIVAALDTVTPAADAKAITLSKDIQREPMTITADAGRLQQIVWNLLTNAVKFTAKGGTVRVQAYREGSDIHVSVSDTGEGMRPEVLALIFEPFQQADATTTRRHGGLGLGLAIVKQLVTAHGGTVTAKSDGEGKGSSFSVVMPARSAVPSISTIAVAGGGPAPRLDGVRLLVVDDEEDARELVGTVLREQGAEVHLFASASEALDGFADLRPDVVVSDIGMPLMDGYSLIRKIRALPPALGGRTPAVALTAYARAEDAQRAFAAGYQMHLPKPIEPGHLATIVANLAGRSQDPAA